MIVTYDHNMFIEHVVVIFLLKILILSTAKPTNTIVAALEKDDLWANRKTIRKKAIFGHIKIEIKCPFQGYYIQKGPTSLA